MKRLTLTLAAFAILAFTVVTLNAGEIKTGFVHKIHKTDKKRVFLTGLSMGGFGTWSLAAAHPERWAAIAPICGGGDPKMAEKIKDIPCWCFHGDADKTVSVEKSRAMIQALKD